MKSYLIVICFAVFLGVVFGQKYNSRFDDIDVDAILTNKRVLNNYIKCILYEGPCTAEGREFRKNIPEAIVTSCDKCTDAQKDIVRKTSNFIKKTQPQDWERIRQRYDSQGKYKESFDRFLNSN